MNIDIRLGSYADVLSDVQANLIFTSPPYNIGSKAPRQDGQRKFGKFDPKSYGAITDYPDNLPEAEYQDQQVSFLVWCVKHLCSGGTLVYNHKPRRRNMRLIHPMEWAVRVPELALMEEVIWDRGSTHNHSNRMMWPTTERLYVFRRADDPAESYALVNGASLDYRSDVWRINPPQSNGHNAPFPEELARAVINAWSEPGDLVCDPYSGSGTVAVAARDLGRNFIGAELMEKYWKLSNERLGR